MSKFIKILSILAVFSVLIFSILMLNTISQYATFDKNVGFLRFKQEVVGNRFWLLFFYIHIFSVTLCLLAGLTQFSNRFLTENKKLHKIIGRIYVYNILIVNVPSCFVLAVFSNGGAIGITGFLVQNILWIYFTVSGIRFIKKGNIIRHKNYMILSYAVTTTAITFRIIKNVFYYEDIFSYQLFYGFNVWISLLINVSIAYLITKKQRYLTFKTNGVDKNSE